MFSEMFYPNRWFALVVIIRVKIGAIFDILQQNVLEYVYKILFPQCSRVYFDGDYLVVNLC